MNERQFSDRIGNVDDRLIQQAAQPPHHRRTLRRQLLRQCAAVAAVAALMVGSFRVGALAFPREIYIEKQQERIDVGDSGISLILPDAWAGKYGCDTLDSGDVCVYSRAVRADGTGYAGNLFWVECLDGQYPLDFSYAQPGYTIATTASHTYRLVLASDAQYDSGNPDVASEYTALYESIPQIKILLSDWLTEHSENASNWVDGTVSVEYLGEVTADGQEVIKTVSLDAAASAAVTQLIQGQDYSIENASFFCDLVFLIDGRAYLMNSQTGETTSAGGFSAVLSTEDLQALLSLLAAE